tara:strand:+ start:432 stop:677 length:246 start_codon:yes stop_codon:yes gene_type:complete
MTKAKVSNPSANKLTEKSFFAYLEKVFKETKQTPVARGSKVSPAELWKAGIPHAWQGEDLVLMSSKGYAKAKRLGLLKPQE